MPVPGLLSGHRANEVINRQDADPIHFVSSVFIACAGLCEASGNDKALRKRALSFLQDALRVCCLLKASLLPFHSRPKYRCWLA